MHSPAEVEDPEDEWSQLRRPIAYGPRHGHRSSVPPASGEANATFRVKMSCFGLFTYDGVHVRARAPTERRIEVGIHMLE